MSVPLLFAALLVLSNPVALGTRTRRGWIGVDLISLGAASAAALWSLQLLRFWGARESIWRTFILFAAATALGGAIASLRQLRTGRTETDRAQRLLSLTFLFASLLITCALVGFTHWLVRPPIRSLWADQAFAASLGPDWVQVSGHAGRAPDIQMRFLLQPGTGRSLLLGPIAPWFDVRSPFLSTSVDSSLDGSTIVLWELDPGAAGSLRLHKLATDAQPLVATPTPITADRSAERWALSPNGRSIAMVERTGTNQDPKRLVVYTILTGAVEASILIPACQWRGNILFVSSREVLVPCDGWPRLAKTDEEKKLLREVPYDEVGRLLRVDLEQKTVTGDELIRLGPPPNEAVSGASRLIRGSAGWFAVEKISTSAADRSWQLVELESRRTVMTFALPAPAGGADINPSGQVLRDGRLVLTWSDQETSGLQVFDVNGKLARAIPFPPGADLRILAEASDASLLVCSRRPGSRDWNVLQVLRTVDLDSGQVRELASWAWVPRLQDRGLVRSVSLTRSSKLTWFDPRSKILKPLFSDDQYLGDRKTLEIDPRWQRWSAKERKDQ